VVHHHAAGVSLPFREVSRDSWAFLAIFDSQTAHHRPAELGGYLIGKRLASDYRRQIQPLPLAQRHHESFPYPHRRRRQTMIAEKRSHKIFGLGTG